MRLFVAVTDNDWFALHAALDRVKKLTSGVLHPRQHSRLFNPVKSCCSSCTLLRTSSLVAASSRDFSSSPSQFGFRTFREANGVSSLTEMRERIAYYRRSPIGPRENPTVGCIMLAEPFFWPRNQWIPCPRDFKLNTVQGKGYDSEIGAGRELWEAVAARLQSLQPTNLEPGTATLAAVQSNGFGKPQIILPRLGQGLFRILVTDFYERRCAITGERTLPVLDAAHIKPYTLTHLHEVSNGLLLRSDLHRLFDGGYITVDPQNRGVVVSKRIKEEFENGREYYKLEGQVLREPSAPWARPSLENLEYHAYNLFQ